MECRILVGALAMAAGVCMAGVHPDTSADGWRNLLGDVGTPLENVASFKAGTWSRTADGGMFSTVDSALWFKGEYEDFILDLEYKLDPAANSGVIVYCSDIANWIPNSVEIQLLDDNADKWKKDAPRLKNGSIYGHVGPEKSSVKPAGEWNRMTIWAQGKRIKVAVNDEITVDTSLAKFTDAKKNPDGSAIPPWLSRPLADLPTKGAIGLQGMHGGAKPYFRNVKINELDKR